jgi:hypothetical protein
MPVAQTDGAKGQLERKRKGAERRLVGKGDYRHARKDFGNLVKALPGGGLFGEDVLVRLLSQCA